MWLAVFLDACLSATLSSVVLNVGGAAPFYRLDHYNTEVGRGEL